MASKRPDMMLWLSDARGVYIPRDFADSFDLTKCTLAGIKEDSLEVLRQGPEHEDYWDAWCDVADNCVVTDNTIATEPQQFRVYQDGDCWLVPVGMEWSEDEGTFVWPEEEG